MASFVQERSPGCYEESIRSHFMILLAAYHATTYLMHFDSHNLARRNRTLARDSRRPTDVTSDIGARHIGHGRVGRRQTDTDCLVRFQLVEDMRILHGIHISSTPFTQRS